MDLCAGKFVEATAPEQDAVVRPHTPSWLVLLLVLPLTACAATVNGEDANAGAQEDRVRHTPAPPPSPTAVPVRSASGQRTGTLIASVTPPSIEAGLRGALQAIPSVSTRPIGALEARWTEIKQETDLMNQHARITRERLSRQVGTGLIDLRSLEGAGLPPFGSRDRIRGRSWVTPTMAAVLIDAWQRFHPLHPDARLSLGDLAQPGGGTLYHNVIVRDLVGGDAERLLDGARLHGGEFVSHEHHTASAFPDELGRFESPEDRVWTRHVLTADASREAHLALRVATTRYTFPHDASPSDARDAFAHMRRLVSKGVLVRSHRVRHLGEDNRIEHLWRQHWIDTRRRRQLVTLSTKKQRKGLKEAWLIEARVAAWRRNKPDSFADERRWVRRGPNATDWTRWQAMREAGHVSHMGGSDADISFVTRGNQRHFAIDLSVLDAAKTWDWFKALDAAATALDTRVEAILLSRSIINALSRHLPAEEKRSKLWRQRVRRSPGHDAHHHLRLTKPTAQSERKAKALLEALSPSASPGTVSPEPPKTPRPPPPQTQP